MTKPKPKPRKPSALETKVLTILSEQFFVDETELTPQIRFVEDLGADDFDLVEMVMSIEASNLLPFNEIPFDDAEKLLTVGQVIDYVQKYAA
jgi:acyl carrier protein